jgi:hypothetical protein
MGHKEKSVFSCVDETKFTPPWVPTTISGCRLKKSVMAINIKTHEDCQGLETSAVVATCHCKFGSPQSCWWPMERLGLNEELWAAHRKMEKGN